MEFRSGAARVRVNLPDRAAALEAVRARLERREGFALATLNLDHLVKLRGDARFAAAYAAQDFVVADGNPVVWLSRLAGQPVALVPGADLVVPLARLAAETGTAVALVGSTASALEAAADTLRRAVPELRVAACIAPGMGFEPGGAEAGAVLERLRDSGAGLCLLALGAPRQEMLAARGRAALPHMGFASIGAGVDFLAGRQRRAPLWVRRLALEWLWRAAGAPARLGPRYARCAAILPEQAAQALKRRGRLD